MNMRSRYFLLVFMVLLSCAVLVSAADVDQKVINSIHKDQKALVIVLLKDTSNVGFSSSKISSKALPVLKHSSEAVLSKLNVKLAGSSKISSEENYDLELKHVYSSLNEFSGEITSAGLAKLENDPLVDKIVSNERRRVFLTESVPLINATKVWNITVNGMAIDGTGQSVCVVDTGVDYTHPALGGCSTDSFLAGTCSKVPSGYDFVNLDDDPLDDHGHGTHVSGIVASTDEVMGPYKGVAPNAKIVAMKVCDSSGGCLDGDVIAGIERCIDNATVYNISVISISLGGDQINSYCDVGIGAAYAPTINRAVGQNISVVIATGNSGYNGLGISVPACVHNATRVTATDKSDVMANYASRDSAFDILAAPGSSIVSLQPGGATALASGTSMATPHVSGAIALLQQFYKLQKSMVLTPNQLKDTLSSTGKSIDDTANSGVNYPRINVYGALLSLNDLTPPTVSLVSPTPANASTINGSSLTITISADESLSSAVLQWGGVNESMTGSGKNYSRTKAGLRSGTYTYKVIAQDIAGNYGDSELRTVILQGQPTITFTYPVPGKDNYVSQPFLMNVSVRDEDLVSFANYSIADVSGLVFQFSSIVLDGALEFTFGDAINISNPLYADGNYTIMIYANDTLGDEKTSKGTFIVDKTVPLLYSSSISPLIIYNTNNVTFRVNATDTHLSSEILEANFTGTWTNYTLQQESGDTYYYTMRSGNLSNQETVGYRFYAGDRADNLNVSDLASFTVQNRVPTSLNIISPASGLVLEVGSSISVNGNALDDDGDALTYSWNFGDGSLLATGQSSSHTFNTTGTDTILFNVSDSYSSNSTTAPIVVNDTIPPHISTLSFDGQHHVQQEGNQSVSATIFDYSGISTVSLVSEGKAYTPACTQATTSWTCFWSWGNMTAGSRSFTINVTDNFATAHRNSSTYSFTVQTCSDLVQNGNEVGVDCGGSCATACPVSDSGSSSSSGGGGGGGSSPAAKASTASTPVTTPSTTAAASSGSEAASAAGAEESSAKEDTKTAEQAAPTAAAPAGFSFGNRLTGFFGKIIPSNLSFNFSGKGIAVGVLSVVILGLGSL